MTDPLWTREQLSDMIDMAERLGIFDDAAYFRKLIQDGEYRE